MQKLGNAPASKQLPYNSHREKGVTCLSGEEEGSDDWAPESLGEGSSSEVAIIQCLQSDYSFIQKRRAQSSLAHAYSGSLQLIVMLFDSDASLDTICSISP